MTLNIQLSPEFEVALRERAFAAGLDVDSYVTRVVKEELAAENEDEVKRRLSLEEFQARLQQIIDLHPKSRHVVDDSRESIYAGRGE